MLRNMIVYIYCARDKCLYIQDVKRNGIGKEMTKTNYVNGFDSVFPNW